MSINKKINLFAALLLGSCVSTFAQPEYKDVAQIFFDRCSNCHHAGTAAPFSLTEYASAFTWQMQIKAAVESGEMPPWLPDTTYRRYTNEHIISQVEKDAIIAWVDGGALAGDTTQAPAAPVYTTGYVLKGTPDLVVKVPPYTSTATTSDIYVCIPVPTGLTEDRYIRAFEIVPGKAEILHHAILMIDSDGTAVSNLTGGCFQPTGDYRLGGWAPGAPPSVFPNSTELKTGMWIKGGASQIVFQLHYPAGSSGMVDSTEVRIFLYPLNEPNIRPMHSSTPLQNWLLYVFPEMVQSFSVDYPKNNTIDVPWSIFSTFPHSHLIAKDIINYAYTSTDTIPLIHIPDWDFHWQGDYVFRNLIEIPAGYKLHATHSYDNTSSNPHNPNNPPKLVTVGPGTGNEMLFDSYQWLYYLPGDENINIDSLLKNDVLLTGIELNAEKRSANSMYSAVYPNPFSETTKLTYQLTSAGDVSVSVYNIYGDLVLSNFRKAETTGYHEFVWNGKNDAGAQLSAGTYFYTVRSGASTGSGKIMLLPK